MFTNESIWFMVEIQKLPSFTSLTRAQFARKLFSPNSLHALGSLQMQSIVVWGCVSCVNDGLWYNPFEVKTFRTSDVRNLRLETRRRQRENFTSNDKTNLKSNRVRLCICIQLRWRKYRNLSVLRTSWILTFAFYSLRYSSVKFNSNFKLIFISATFVWYANCKEEWNREPASLVLHGTLESKGELCSILIFLYYKAWKYKQWMDR